MWKTQLVLSFILLILIFTICIRNSSTSSSPFLHILNIPITNFHSLIVQTTTFSKSFNNKMSLTSYPLNTKIKPSRYSIRITLFLQLNLKSIISCLFDIMKITTLKITFKCYRAYLDYTTHVYLHFTNVSINLFVVYIVRVMFLR